MQKTFILIGPSGCGKGTQGALIAKHVGETLYIQTGAAIRDFIKGDTYTQRLASDAYLKGGLMPEFITIHMWVKILADSFTGKENIIFDGTPRKVHEAGTLHSIIDFYKLQKPTVIVFELSREKAIERLLLRKRLDDHENEIVKRLDWYETHVVPVVKFYENNPHYNLVKINADQPVEKVFADILEKI